MALFFDRSWFAARLAALNLQKEDLARAVGWTNDELGLVFKDQKEVSAADVSVLAALLGVSAEEIASRCGISTLVLSQPAARDAEIDRLLKRVAALEAKVNLIEAALKDR